MSTASNKKSPSFPEWLAARTQAMELVQIRHNETAAFEASAQLLADKAVSNPAAFSHHELVEIARDLSECKAALALIPAEDVGWQTDQVGKAFITDNVTEIAAAAKVKLSELTARTPTVKEPILTKIFDLTRKAIGLPDQARSETLEARDRREQAIADLDTFASAAATQIEYFKNNPSPESLTAVVGGLASFEHELTAAAKL